MTKLSQSSGSSPGGLSDDSEEIQLRNFTKRVLKNRLFIGTFVEKRFVEPLGAYRDVVKVADDETDFVENLSAVKQRCAKFYTGDVWIGITDPKTIGGPTGHNLWVTLQKEVFGSYWYKLKTVDFRQNEVCLKLEVVRPVSTETGFAYTKQDFQEYWKIYMSELGQKLSVSFSQKITTVLTLSNMKDAVVFVFLLLLALLTFLVQGLKYFLDYSLKFIHEMSGLIKAFTPITISVIKLIMIAVNGFYNLIATMWRDRAPPTINQNLYHVTPTPRPALPYDNRRALPYSDFDDSLAANHSLYQSPGNNPYYNFNRYPSSVKITPLD